MSDAQLPGRGQTGEDDGHLAAEWRAVALRLGAALLILGGVYLGAAVYLKDRPPAGTSVAGVSVGSMSRTQAEAHLERELADRLREPLTVELTPEGADGEAPVEELTLVPEESGLSYDIEATLDDVVGLSLDPRVLWAHVSGRGRDIQPVGRVDEAVLTGAVQAAAEDYDQEAVEGEVALVDGTVEITDAAQGRRLDVPATVEAVADAWPEESTVEGSAVAVGPVLTQEELDRFAAEEVEPALAAPVVVTAQRGEGDDAPSATAEISPTELAGMLQVTRSDDGAALSLVLDEDALVDRVREDLDELELEPRDATVRLDGSDVEVVPARAGAELELDGLATAVDEAMAATGNGRTVTLDLREVEPQIPTSASEDWTFSAMGSFESVFPTGAANEARTANLRAGVRHLNGTVVMPGEQFSLGRALGDISEAGGYVEAPIIVDGRLVMGIGGGLSQISTVVFNTSWASGVQLDAHTPHSYYIPRYPAGREATLAYPAIDNLWTNDTDNPVVVRSWISGSTIHMVYLGDRQYTVSTYDGEKVDRTEGTSEEDDSPDCVPQSGSDGFTITNVRILSRDGSEVKRDEYTTTYRPADEIVCTHPDAGY